MVKQTITVISKKGINPSYLIEVYQINKGVIKRIECNCVKINGIDISSKGFSIRKHKDLINIKEMSNTIVDIQVQENF